MQLFSQIILSGLTIGSIYALIALGFTLIFNVSKIINLAQGQFVMIGAMVYFSFVTSFDLPLLISLLFGLIITAIVGWLMVKVAIDPLGSKYSPIFAIIVTIAFGEILQGLALLVWGKSYVGIPAILQGDSINIFGGNLEPQALMIMVVSLIVCILFTLLMNKTNIGKTMVAASSDSYAAGLMGINVKKIIVFSFMISAALGAIAGILVGPITMMDYHQGTFLGIKGFIAALLGGMGSYPGAIVGGLLIGLLESFGGGYISSLMKDAFAFAILLLVLLYKPRGLMKSKV
ncbi:branched-chain amino acid ABC transporter permease [Bacillus sp. M6-12]|uniref:branched-chain amino acid ABC transporter permease n=1 Tax=Bacillus sp. M6-12 TaxID=2054166 RepID=UPI001C60A359|nr:branched-chain amino acid ABC transporter permease [Bacillus sp. M6-12]